MQNREVMHMLLAIITALQSVLWLPAVHALSARFLTCQLQKPERVHPLIGCPSGTLFVSGNDTRAQFRGVQEAVASL